MPVPLPTPADTLLTPPDAAEAEDVARGIVSVIAPADGLTPLQSVLVDALMTAMTGNQVDLAAAPLPPPELAERLSGRNEAFRTRVLQMMILGALVLRPLPIDVADRVRKAATELSIDDGMIDVAQAYAEGSYCLAAHDFERNGYTADWAVHDHHELHASGTLEAAWQQSGHDAGLAAQWRSLEELPPDALGRRVVDFYRARGFAYPGEPGSAPPLLAQHDWVHVMADYGTTVESELEVFGFISRANDDPHAFSLLAMVISLFETGYLASGAGLFEASPGQLEHRGVAVRLADAMRRGALVDGSIDFLAIDWFALADQPVDEVRARFGVVAKAPTALADGSVGPWESGGISEFQLRAGQARADAEGRPYDTYGASLARPAEDDGPA